MTQTVPATCVLGPGLTGLTIGVTVLNIDGTTYAAFSTSGVVETGVAGTYRKAGGVTVPDAGGYLVWGVSGTPYAEATVEPLQVTSTQAGYLDVAVSSRLASASYTAPPSAAANADAVWDEALAGHAGAGSAGAALAAILEDTGTTLPGLIAASGTGSGAITFVYTLTNSVGGSPIADADVWVTSDEDGDDLLASGRTNQNGVVTFYLDAGTVYVWRQKSGWDFVNPDVEVVS